MMIIITTTENLGEWYNQKQIKLVFKWLQSKQKNLRKLNYLFSAMKMEYE